MTFKGFSSRTYRSLLAQPLLVLHQACTPGIHSTWTYDKNKMQFVGQDASVQVLSATKIRIP